MSARRRDAWTWGLAAVVVAGAAVRFATLGVQSLWFDEAATHALVTRSLGSMLSAIPHSESTPPLFYVLEWGWVRIFGAGAVAMRALPALFGSATIVVLAAIARRLSGRTAALAAAALAASSPLLIWYSQEARAYSLLVLLCAITVWCLLRADWVGWALAAALALATHYFALFIVVPELVVVAWQHGRRSRAAALSAAAVALVGAALLPLAVVQASGDRAHFITSSGLGGRVAAVPKQFLIGYATPHAVLLTVLAAIAALALVPFLRRRDRPLAVLAAIAVGVPILLAAGGADYVITRNLIMAMVPLVVLAALAAARTRAGPALIALLCAVGIAAFVGVETTPADQRDDWRAVARAIGPLRGPTATALVVEPANGALPLEIYAPLAGLYDKAAIYTRAVDVVVLGHDAPVPATPAPLAGFSATVEHNDLYTMVRYSAPAPVQVVYGQLATLALEPSPAFPSILDGPCAGPGRLSQLACGAH